MANAGPGGSIEHEGRVVLVSGAARGMGLAIAQALAKDGARVAIVDARPDEGQADRLATPAGASRYFQCDLSDCQAVADLIGWVSDWSGGCDMLVHNAALFPTTPLETLDLERWRGVFAVNLDAAMLLSQGFEAGMRARKWGRIVTIASGTVGMGRRDVAAYIASKMGLIGLTRALASDLGPSGITANSVAPGFVETEGTREKFPQFDELARSVVRQQTVPRLLTASEIGQAVSFLCSPGAAMITGQTWMMDGGWVRL